jgi:hypothetical protein
MPAAWTCSAEPKKHGSFLQLGLDNLSAIFGAVQPMDRYACPVCLAQNQSGWMKPATESEVAALSHQLQEA